MLAVVNLGIGVIAIVRVMVMLMTCISITSKNWNCRQKEGSSHDADFSSNTQDTNNNHDAQSKHNRQSTASTSICITSRIKRQREVIPGHSTRHKTDGKPVVIVRATVTIRALRFCMPQG